MNNVIDQIRTLKREIGAIRQTCYKKDLPIDEFANRLIKLIREKDMLEEKLFELNDRAEKKIKPIVHKSTVEELLGTVTFKALTRLVLEDKPIAKLMYKMVYLPDSNYTSENKLDITQYLIDLKANLNMVDDGRYLVSDALMSSSWESAKLMLEHNADASILDRAMVYVTCDPNHTSKEIIEMIDLLLKNGVVGGCNVCGHEDTIYRNVNTWRLLEHLADHNTTDFRHPTILNSYVEDNRPVEYLNYMIERKCNPSNLTMAHAVNYRGSKEVVKRLLDFGLDGNLIHGSISAFSYLKK